MTVTANVAFGPRSHNKMLSMLRTVGVQDKALYIYRGKAYIYRGKALGLAAPGEQLSRAPTANHGNCHVVKRSGSLLYAHWLPNRRFYSSTSR